MRNDWIDVEAALQHAGHFVPGFEHLPAVNAFDEQPLENHFVPIDRHVVGRDSEKGDLATVVHRPQQIAKCGGVARHFHADIEPFLHAQVIHRLIN